MLGDLGDWSSGGTPLKKEAMYYGGSIPWVRTGDLKDRVLNDALGHITEDGLRNSAAKIFPKGTLLVAMYGATIGQTAVLGYPAATNQACAALIAAGPTTEVIPYVWLYLLAQRENLKRAGQGGAQPNISQSIIKRFSLALPPLSEQCRIVAKVDSLFAKTKRTREELGHIPRLIERYKQAILAAAFRGDLTQAWRQSVGQSAGTQIVKTLPQELSKVPLPASWGLATMKEAAENHDGKRVPVRASDRAARHGSYPYYGASGVIDTIDDYLFDGHFLLIGEDGANLVSRASPIAFLATGRFWVNNHAHVLRATSITCNEWLCWFVNMIDLTPFVTGTAQPKLTQAALNRINVPIPLPDEQTEIIARIKVAFAWIEKIAKERDGAARLIERLDQSILAKAVKGELVPQDPNDEPAGVLLERIRADCAKQPQGRVRRACGGSD